MCRINQHIVPNYEIKIFQKNNNNDEREVDFVSSNSY